MSPHYDDNAHHETDEAETRIALVKDTEEWQEGDTIVAPPRLTRDGGERAA